MRIEVYGSGSDGNCYGIYDGATWIMLECGVPLKRLNKFADHNLARFEAVFASHSHGDHAATLYEMERRGIPIYCTGETKGLHNLLTATELADGVQYEAGSYIVIPFPLIHKHTITMADCPCFGFLVYSKQTKERLLFATDTMYIKNRFKGLNYIMVECNYLSELLDRENDFIDRRRLETHMSVETAIRFLETQDMTTVKKIIAIHLSNTKSEGAEVLRRLRRATGRPCYIATEGAVFE